MDHDVLMDFFLLAALACRQQSLAGAEQGHGHEAPARAHHLALTVDLLHSQTASL
jgi:hypothetical protein